MGLFDNLKSGLSSAGSALDIKASPGDASAATVPQEGGAVCKQCGAPLLPGATFCGKCGASQAETVESAPISKPLPDHAAPKGSWNDAVDKIISQRGFYSDDLWDAAGCMYTQHEIQIFDVIGFCNVSKCESYYVKGGGSLTLDDLALELIDIASDYYRLILKIKIDREITRGGGIVITANVPDPENSLEANPFGLIVQETYGDDAIFYYYFISETTYRVFVGPAFTAWTDNVVAMTFARLNSKGDEELRPVPWIVETEPKCGKVGASLTEAVNNNSEELLARAAGLMRKTVPSPCDGALIEGVKSYTILDDSIDPYRAIVELGHQMGQVGWKVIQAPESWAYKGKLIALNASGAGMGQQWWNSFFVQVEMTARGHVLYLFYWSGLFEQAYRLHEEGKMLRPDMEMAYQAVSPYVEQMDNYIKSAEHTLIYAVAQLNEKAAAKWGISTAAGRHLPKGSFDEFCEACSAGEYDKARELDERLSARECRVFDDPLADSRFCATYLVPLGMQDLEALADTIEKASSVEPLLARVVDRPDGRKGKQLIELTFAGEEAGQLWQKGCHWYIVRRELQNEMALLYVFLSSCEMDKAIAMKNSGAVLPPDVKALADDCEAHLDRIQKMRASLKPPAGIAHVIRLLNNEWLKEKSQSQD